MTSKLTRFLSKPKDFCKILMKTIESPSEGVTRLEGVYCPSVIANAKSIVKAIT